MYQHIWPFFCNRAAIIMPARAQIIQCILLALWLAHRALGAEGHDTQRAFLARLDWLRLATVLATPVFYLLLKKYFGVSPLLGRYVSFSRRFCRPAVFAFALGKCSTLARTQANASGCVRCLAPAGSVSQQRKSLSFLSRSPFSSTATGSEVASAATSRQESASAQ